ncbi:uncharacterized protein LOC110687601 [Chenopodium quinoa]|uniref:Uncharacterized protein n=1 Tax=Chenopodium quinoa TaxID=63459 RepID=A0A803KQI5_CHEQI|nr:uncharacterized protein LOC110687601 [Chenopodium quinoa]
MVSRVEEAIKGRQQQQQRDQVMQIVQCNKSKVKKFKRSSSNLEEDGASSAIFFLACIACAPSSSYL